MTDTKTLQMRDFQVDVLIVPSCLETSLTGIGPHYETRTVTGYTLKDAMKRAGIR